jgi:hypothetical protein
VSVKDRWRRLSPRTRRLVVLGGSFEAVLKVTALVDLARRPPEQVRGKKWLWALAIIPVNSVGALPLAYLRFGRRKGA